MSIGLSYVRIAQCSFTATGSLLLPLQAGADELGEERSRMELNILGVGRKLCGSDVVWEACSTITAPP